jgi:hypothetical protein
LPLETVSRLASRTIAAAALAAPFIVLATVAPAQMQNLMQCGPHARIVEVLAGKYGEAPKAIGAIDQDRFMEIYVSDAGSWTVLMTTTNGTSCIIAAGGDWEDVPFKPGARS